MQPAELQQMLGRAWQVLDSLDVGAGQSNLLQCSRKAQQILDILDVCAGKCCCQLVIFFHSICCILAL
jgi:hypothetical protein